jgi:hypothetical protein
LRQRKAQEFPSKLEIIGDRLFEKRIDCFKRKMMKFVFRNLRDLIPTLCEITFDFDLSGVSISTELTDSNGKRVGISKLRQRSPER